MLLTPLALGVFLHAIDNRVPGPGPTCIVVTNTLPEGLFERIPVEPSWPTTGTGR